MTTGVVFFNFAFSVDAPFNGVKFAIYKRMTSSGLKNAMTSQADSDQVVVDYSWNLLMLKILWTFREAFRAALLTIPEGWTDINEIHRVEHLANSLAKRSCPVKCVERKFPRNPQPLNLHYQENDE